MKTDTGENPPNSRKKIRTTPTAVIIGAGPAGLSAAEVMAEAGAAVTVIERMPSPARKFLLAGRGGLNLTHSEPLDGFLGRYADAPGPILEAVRRFTPADLVAWCEGLGQPTFVGSSGRIFPKSLKASPVLRAWLRRLDTLGVRVLFRSAFVGWAESGQLRVETPAGLEELCGDVTVLALGGASWPRLGSDGAWAQALREAGIEVMPLRPSNMGIDCAWSPHLRERFAGQPLKRIALSFGARRVAGEAVITATGLEGGAVYALSAPIREALATHSPVRVLVDLRPDLSADALGRRLAVPRGARSLSTQLRKRGGLSPAAIALLRESRLADGAALPDAAEDLARLIKAVPLRVESVRPLERAISSAGGIALAELDPHFMLRKRPGTFVAGEMLDWEAPTGGYLLQASIATGRAAGEGALRWLAARRDGGRDGLS
jgi:uncharacterized flavoprotein (TIGR03862 family)